MFRKYLVAIQELYLIKVKELGNAELLMPVRWSMLLFLTMVALIVVSDIMDKYAYPAKTQICDEACETEKTSGSLISGNGIPGDTVEITSEEGKVICQTVVRQDNTWECERSPETKDGEYHLVMVNTSRNSSAVIGHWHFTLDSIAPDDVVVNKPANHAVVNPRKITFKGKGTEAGTTVQVRITGLNQQASQNSPGLPVKTVVCEASVAQDMTWECISAFPDYNGDTLTAEIVAVDVAGNTSQGTVLTLQTRPRYTQYLWFLLPIGAIPWFVGMGISMIKDFV